MSRPHRLHRWDPSPRGSAASCTMITGCLRRRRRRRVEATGHSGHSCRGNLREFAAHVCDLRPRASPARGSLARIEEESGDKTQHAGSEKTAKESMHT